MLDVEQLVPDAQDADLRVTKGRPVRDILEVMTTAEGGVDVPGAPTDSDTKYLTADDRADAVARAVRDFLVEDFPERPLDAFDDEGNAVDTSQPIYGEDLSPPVQVTTCTWWPASTDRAIRPPHAIDSSSGCGWTHSRRKGTGGDPRPGAARRLR